MEKHKILEELGLDEPALPVERYREMSRDEEWDYVREKFPHVPHTFLAKIDFCRHGVDMSERALKKVQDSYYSKGPRILFQWHHLDFTEPYNLPLAMKLNDATTVILQLASEESGGQPYKLDYVDDKFFVLSGERVVEEVDFFKAPRYELEGKTTRNGVPLNQIAQLTGSSCVLVIPNSHCQYWNEGMQCRFCDMDYNARLAMKMGRGFKVRLRPEDVYDFTSEILKEKGRWMRFVMTGGSNPKENYERELTHLISLIKAIKEAGAPYEPYNIPINLVATPYEKEKYQRLKDVGLEAVGCYFETWKKEHFEKVCPGKAKYIGYDSYIKNTLGAVEIFGEGNVTAGFVPGVEMAPPPYGFAEVDDAVASSLEGYDFLIRNGVVPLGTNWCIQPGTDFFKMGCKQPPLEFYVKLDVGRYRLLKKHWNGRLSADQMEYKFQPIGTYPEWQRLL